MVLCLIMSIFAFIMIYLIEFYKLIRISIYFGIFQQINPMKMNLSVIQQIYEMISSEILRVLLSIINSIILFRERRRKSQQTIGNSFDDFRLMIVDPTQKLAYGELQIILDYLGLSSENKSKEVISKTFLTHIKIIEVKF